jgi:hypothetical protein
VAADSVVFWAAASVVFCASSSVFAGLAAPHIRTQASDKTTKSTFMVTAVNDDRCFRDAPVFGELVLCELHFLCFLCRHFPALTGSLCHANSLNSFVTSILSHHSQ